MDVFLDVVQAQAKMEPPAIDAIVGGLPEESIADFVQRVVRGRRHGKERAAGTWHDKVAVRIPFHIGRREIRAQGPFPITSFDR